MDELLHKLYYDPKTGFQSLDKLYRKAVEIDSKITKKYVKNWLEKQETVQITQQVNKTKTQYSTIKSLGVRNNYQSD